MSNIEQILSELMKADSFIFEGTIEIKRECDKITNTMNKVQRVFGDQQSGCNLAVTLYELLQDLINAEVALNSVRTELKQYVEQIQK